MDGATQLRKTVAGFFDVDEGQVIPSFSLEACRSSIARASFDAAIRRGLGVTSNAVYTSRTFADLAAGLGIIIEGASAPPSSATTLSSPSPIAIRPAASMAGAACGVDIELIESLPVVDDPWEDTFYRTHFSDSEIAYCLRQADPRPHFAARWCAKEALKKCDRAFLAVDGNAVEVVHDESGVPHLVHLGPASPSRLPHALSLSHTGHSAVAMVVRVDAARPMSKGVDPAPTAPIPASVAAPRRSRWLPVVLVMLNLAAIGLAAVAIYRTFPGLVVAGVAKR